MKLYEIASELESLIDEYNSTDMQAEQQSALELSMTQLKLSFNEKAVSVAKYVINTDSEIEALKNEIERLSAQVKYREKRKEWLKKYLLDQMLVLDLNEVKDAITTIKIKNNPPSVVIENESLVPESYKRIIPATTAIDKMEIKKAWENGVGVAGTKIERKLSLSIK